MFDLRKLADFHANPPATREQICLAETQMGLTFPADYVDFLLAMDGGEGFVGDFYAQFDPCSQLKSRNEPLLPFNESQWAILFGGDGGGEALAFDREVTPWRVVLVPLIGFDKKDALYFGDSFTDFLSKLSDGFEPFRK